MGPRETRHHGPTPRDAQGFQRKQHRYTPTLPQTAGHAIPRGYAARDLHNGQPRARQAPVPPSRSWQALQAAVTPDMKTSFDRHTLRQALPQDPMLLESTLPPPGPAPIASWTGPVDGPPDMLLGPDGEPWAQPSDDWPQNSFGPLAAWDNELFLLPDSGTMTGGTQPVLDADAEHVALPSGLLESPPHTGIGDHLNLGTGDNALALDLGTSVMQRFIDTVTAPPPAPALPLAATHISLPPPGEAAAAQRRCSERQRVARASAPAAQTATQRAIQAKEKRMGTQQDQRTAATLKKQTYMSKYSGQDTLQAQRAFDDLLQEAASAPQQ